MSKSFDVDSRPALASDRDWKNPLWNKAPYILANELCERLCYYGMSTNLSMYLKHQLGYGTSSAASLMQIWQGTAYLTPLIGAYLADAHLGRFKVIGIFSTIYMLGMALLTVTTFLPGLKPPGDGTPANGLQITSFWIALYTIALGTGGIKPNVSAFGADQFNPDDPREAKQIPRFFNYFYVAINLGSLIASTAIVYIQDNVSWTIGFLVPTIAMALAIVCFFVASGKYYKKPPAGNPYRDMFKILGCAFGKLKTPLPQDPAELYEVEDEFYIKKGIHRMPHTERKKWLDHAAIQGPGITKVKTVTEVEEVKQLGSLLPIAVIAIAYQTLYTQMFSMFVMQGDCMNKTGAPSAGMMTTFDIIAILVGMPLYDSVLVPLLNKITTWTTLKRIGWGYLIAAIAIAMGAIVEMVRLSQVNALGMQLDDPSVDPPPLSIWWQIPQYLVIGVSEIFAMSGMYEFFYQQAPDSMVSFSMAIQLLTVAAGSYLSSLLVFILGLITCCPGWLPPAGYTLNQGHMDYFFWLLFVMQIFAIGLHIIASKRFTPKQVIEWPHAGDADELPLGDDDMVDMMPSKYSFAVGSELARKTMERSASKTYSKVFDDETERLNVPTV
jgi:solute carrier family 15 (peptide/histidine transporter), member 3/4